ncbi:MAG TPA: ATP-binding protein [Gammaproteobacteria bacterium]
MSLRAQLLAFGLLTLVLPWAGYRFVQEMEAALRRGLEQALVASAGTVAAALDGQTRLLEPPAVKFGGPRGATIYGLPLAAEPRIDGLRDDWSSGDESAILLDGGHRLWAGVHERSVYLYLAAADADVVYEGAPEEGPHGDRLLLVVEPFPRLIQRFLLATRAPGSFRARITSPPLFVPGEDFEDRIQSAWQETEEGFGVEIRLPLDLAGQALGVALIDVDRAASQYRDASAYPGDSGYRVAAVAASWPIGDGAPGPFVYQRPDLERFVRQFSQAGDRFRVLDADGWVLSDTGSTTEPLAQQTSAGGLAGTLFRYLLRRDDPEYSKLEHPPGRLGDETLRQALSGSPATAWYRAGPDQSATVAAAVPIRGPDGVLGAVLLEQRSDPILTLTNRALLRLMTFTLLATVVAAVGLLGYASLLSYRVRKLARAAENALGPKGEIDVSLPGRSSRDELGDLSRSFADLLERLREHTQYLKTLAGKLSHELRTPLAVVSTSLDNLEHEVDSPGARPYLERLRGGASRLDSILAAMSEATRIEQAIGDTEPERFDLAAVVEACARAYADIYTERVIRWRIAVDRAETIGSGELVAQMIDKLVDNAVGFSTAGSPIDIELDDDGELVLRVANEGPLLPEEMRDRLFDSLVSMRDGHDDGRPHLGLGLHIVALIADFHGGRVTADNRSDGSGAVFSVRFPKNGTRY